MASSSRKETNAADVVFVREDDGSVTARDLQTGLARGGATRAEALRLLAEVLKLHEGAGDPIENPDEFLQGELDIDPDDLDVTRELPEFVRCG